VTHERHGTSCTGTSASCFTASCGDAPLNIIRQYIEQQKHPAQQLPG